MRDIVSVIIPVFNYADFVEQAVQSILSQSSIDFEVLAIDDASTDESPRILSRLGDSRLRTIIHATNIGHLRTYEEGIEEARGSLLVILSADDIAVGRFTLASQARALTSQSESVFAYTNFLIIDPNGVTLAKVKPLWSPDRQQLFRLLLRKSFIMHSGTMFRREAFVEVGGFDPRLTHAADWDLWLRFLASGYRATYVPDGCYGYRVHARNMHARQHRAHDRSQQRWLVLTKLREMDAAAVSRHDLRRLALDNARDCLKARDWRNGLHWLLRVAKT